MCEELLIQTVRRHQPRAHTELDEQQKEQCCHRCQLRPLHPRDELIGDRVHDEAEKQRKREHHRILQNLLRLRLFEEKQERGEDLDEPERPVGIRAPRHVLRPLHRLRTPCEVEKLMMQIVAENEHGEEEVDAEDCLEPRRHCAFKNVLIRCPCDPEQCHRETAAKHIVEIPEEAFECCVVCERENLRHAVELPEQEHGDEEENGAPRSVVEHALSERHPPDNRHNEGEDEDDEPLMRLRRREERALTDLRVVACVCCTQGEEKIGRNCTRGEDICGGRVACRRKLLG